MPSIRVIKRKNSVNGIPRVLKGLSLAEALGLTIRSTGVLEQWSDGKTQNFQFLKQFIDRPLNVIQHSNTPVLHYSGTKWTTVPVICNLALKANYSILEQRGNDRTFVKNRELIR